MSAPAFISPQQHRDQAERNEVLANELVGECPEWALTVGFYTALHYVCQYAATYPHPPTSHKGRERWFHKHPELDAIFLAYRDLFRWSEAARYNCPPKTEDICQGPWVEREVLRSRVPDIKAHIDNLMAKQGSAV